MFFNDFNTKRLKTQGYIYSPTCLQLGFQSLKPAMGGNLSLPKQVLATVEHQRAPGAQAPGAQARAQATNV